MANDTHILNKKILSQERYLLQQVTFERNGEAPQTHEVYDVGNAAAILLYDPARKTVLLTRQFRLPTFLNGNADGMITEACAGKLDDESPKACILREVKEELGYDLADAEPVMDVYMSPGAYMEKLYLFAAPYAPHMKTSAGGGLAEEQEDVAAVEIPFAEALQSLNAGVFKDAKTVLLLQHAVLKGWIAE